MNSGRVVSSHVSDPATGNPTGGTTFGPGFAIGWQNGPLGRGEDRKAQNGAFVEDVITAAIDRIEYYQQSRFSCQENAAALDHLRAAALALQFRTQKREDRKVEGTWEE